MTDEPTNPDPAPAGDAADDQAHTEDRAIFEGTCRGGPLDGQDIAVRCPAGFLAVSRPRGLAWIYDHHEDGDLGLHSFLVREEEGRPLDDERRQLAANSDAYDVVAVD